MLSQISTLKRRAKTFFIAPRKHSAPRFAHAAHKISLQKKHSLKQDTESANTTINQHILTDPHSFYTQLTTLNNTHQAILYFEIEPKETAT